MSESITIPVKCHDGQRWGALAYLAKDHDICCEQGDCINEKYSFAGGHRVRIFRLKKQVFWKIPVGTDLDISGVVPATPSPSQPPRRRHGKR